MTRFAAGRCHLLRGRAERDDVQLRSRRPHFLEHFEPRFRSRENQRSTHTSPSTLATITVTASVTTRMSVAVHPRRRLPGIAMGGGSGVASMIDAIGASAPLSEGGSFDAGGWLASGGGSGGGGGSSGGGGATIDGGSGGASSSRR